MMFSLCMALAVRGISQYSTSVHTRAIYEINSPLQAGSNVIDVLDFVAVEDDWGISVSTARAWEEGLEWEGPGMHTVVVLLQHLLGVILGFGGGVGVVDGGLVPADDMSVRHYGGGLCWLISRGGECRFGRDD